MATADSIHATTFSHPSDREVMATRTVRASRERVWQAFTSPEHVPHWCLGPDGWTMPVCEIDLRAGGRWHWGWRNEKSGETMAMDGEYRDVAAPERLVNTERWGGDWPETLTTVMLSEEDGATTIRQSVRYPTPEAMDAALGTGMKEGWAMSYDRLEAHLRATA
jgi:uncharacterized protein YndB with AHSA1/START domain